MLAKLEKNQKMNMTKPNYRDLHRDWKNCYLEMICSELFQPLQKTCLCLTKWTHGNLFLQLSKT